MRILFTTVFDYPHPGGLSTHITTLKAGLEARGHTVDILSFSDVSSFNQKYLTKAPSFIMNKLSKGSGIVWSHHIRQNLLTKLISQKVSNGSGYDIINAQDVIATFASLASGIPTVSTVHGYLSYEAVSKGSVIENSKQAKDLQQLEIRAYQQTKKVITVDQRIKNYVYEYAGAEATAIRNFINIEDFKPETHKRQELRKKYGLKENDHIFFVPRRLTKKNGVIYPALALVDVLKKFPNSKLIYAGTGEALQELKEIVRTNQLEKQITLLGAIPHHEIKDYYSLSDVILVPSVHSAGVEEATSISALEAMGSGLPLIACAVGGLKEIVDHEVDGLLVEEKNVDELSQAMMYLLDQPQIGQSLATAARRKIEAEYSHKTAAQKYEQIYKEALGKS